VNIYLLAERTGWTLDYIRSLDADDYLNMGEVCRALDAAKAHETQRGR
jgi:hypothetical protein